MFAALKLSLSEQADSYDVLNAMWVSLQDSDTMFRNSIDYHE